MKTCLIVDDSPVVRRVAGRIIKELGFECIEAGNGQEALESCQQKMPYMVFTDWLMPVMDGLEFTKELRKCKGGDKPIVIFCSVEDDPAQIERAITSGANAYIPKPFDSKIIAQNFQEIGLL